MNYRLGSCFLDLLPGRFRQFESKKVQLIDATLTVTETRIGPINCANKASMLISHFVYIARMASSCPNKEGDCFDDTLQLFNASFCIIKGGGYMYFDYVVVLYVGFKSY